LLDEALKEKKPCKIELINYTKSGKKYYINITISPVLNYDGEVTHWISIQKDITEYKSQIEQLEIEIQQVKQGTAS
jgi:PAS domain S-box-containing protein